MKAIGLVAISGLLGSSDAKLRNIPSANGLANIQEVEEKQIVKVHERKARHPHVEANMVCGNQCLFKDDNNEWCFETTSPMLVTGWTFYQNAQTNYYNFQFRPFITAQMQLTSNFILSRFLTNLFQVAINKFTSYLYYSMLFKTTGQICLGFGWSTEAISLDIDA